MESNFKGITFSGIASVECNLLNCLPDCLADLNGIWHADCTVRNKFCYRSLLPCYNRYLCPWKINETSCFIFCPLSVTRTWNRRHEFYTLLFYVSLVLQITPQRNHHGPHYYQYTDLTPLPSSPSALSPIQI